MSFLLKIYYRLRSIVGGTVTVDLDAPIDGCPHFTWREALELREWHICAFPDTEQTRHNLVQTAQKLELVRSIIGEPLVITSWYRPSAYNLHIGGSVGSWHRVGLAVDFRPKYMSCNKAKIMLLEHLSGLDLRMENNGRAANWVHIDLGKVYKNRYFKP